MKVTQAQIDQVEFDLDTLTAEDFSDWAAAEQSANYREGAKYIAKAATTCPWGDPHDPASYAKLPITVYSRVSKRLGKALATELDTEKK